MLSFAYALLTVLLVICVVGAVLGSVYLIAEYIRHDYNERADEDNKYRK